MSRRSGRPGAALLAVALAGCATPGPQAPARALLDPRTLGAEAAPARWPALRWWSGFGDARLDAVVEQALAGQPSLLLAEARLRQAQAALDAAGAARAPQVAATADLSLQRFSANGLVPPPLGGSTRWNNSAQLGLRWSLDVGGAERAALEAAIGRVRAAEADREAARVLLAAAAASAYVDLARLGDAADVAARSRAQREQVLALVRQRLAAGLDTTIELRQAEGLVAQADVEIEALREAAGRARRALAELAGQGPRAFDALAPTLAGLASMGLPATLPTDLVGRRADLVALRWRAEAAVRDVDVARAQFVPNVDLVAFAGFASLGLDRFLEAGARTAGVGPALRLPLFDGGRLRANLGARAAERDAAVDAWNAALLRALREVADEIATLGSLARQRAAQTEASAAADATFDLALQRYRAGLGNFLVVLTAQTNVLAQQRNATELRARRLAAEVALARALGGGWSEPGAPAQVAR